MGNTRLAVTLGATIAVIVGCSDDDSPPVTADVDAAVSSASTERPADPTDVSDESTTVSESSSPVTNPGEGSGSSASTDDAASSAPATDTSGTGDLISSVASGQSSGETSAPDPGGTSAPTTDDTGAEGAIPPPNDMLVIANFDTAAGFQDGQHNLESAQVRTYADSLMTVEAAFTGSGQQTGVNFNHSADLCGYDVLARIRLRSGTIATGSVQMRVWSDSWTEFASRSGNIGAVGDWVEYRVTWSDVVANNAALDINAINAVGFAFMTFGAATESVFDVDWIGLVPSATPCPSVDTGDTGSSTTTPDVDSGVETVPDGGVELPNLVGNGSFEAGSAGWSSWGGAAVTPSTAKARTGLQSLLVSGGAGIGPAATIISDIVPGGTYEISMWASTDEGDATVRVVRSLECLPADGGRWLWVVNPTLISDSGWTELTGTFTVPDDCESPSFQVYLEGDTANVDVYLDDVSLTLIGEPANNTADSGVTGAPEVDSGVVDAGAVETTGVVDGTDASVDDTTTVVDGPDASVSDVTSSDIDASAPAETTEVADAAAG